MKKRVLVVLLTVVLLLPFIKVNAGYMDSYIDWTLDRTVFAHKIQNGEEHTNNLAMITANGKVAYCIEPGVDADKASYYSSTTNIYDTRLSWVDTKRLSLIGYYGYGYSGHLAKEYYMATQELIWRFMGVENVWWTDQKYGGNTYNLEPYKNEILSLVNKYEIAPNFSFEEEYMVGGEVVLEDNNKVLEGYEVLNNNDVKIEANKINIKVKEGDNSFTLRRKTNGKNTIFYYKDGYQTIGSFEFPYNFEKSFNINYTYGKILVDKLDFDTEGKDSISSDASLEDAEYGLYDKDGNLIDSKKTDKDGKVEFDKLPKGDYIIKEIKPSKGYTVDKTINEISLDTKTKETVIKSYEKIIKNKIVITKVLDDYKNKMCVPEEGILFHIYDLNGNLIDEGLTDKNGNITLELNYGTYILRQMTSLDNVDKIDDRIIEVKEDGVTQYITLVNHYLPELPNTGKNSIIYLFVTFILSFTGMIYEKKCI